ncbi:MAG: DUF4870 domain-containing protein [Acidobacteria bacterium]|nr:DUF4870 domain-containing protein [Acidobacteriota bacterium]MBS1864773.1 DUF4870 domain-containing protein [Acidobacteriota bacterium]
MSSLAPGPGLYVPTQDEKTFALLVYVLGIFSGFIAPLIFFLVKRDSKFVAFHALQSLTWHIIYMVALIGGIIIAFLSLFASMGFPPGDHAKPPLAFFGIFGIVWLIGAGGGIVNLILGIVYAIKSHNGEWAEFPLIGGWVLRKVVYK